MTHKGKQMAHILLFDLDQNRKHLEYYNNLRSTSGVIFSTLNPKTPKETALDKWITIYENRVQSIEKEVTKLGLRTEPTQIV
jgi:hypothetical protein